MIVHDACRLFRQPPEPAFKFASKERCQAQGMKEGSANNLTAAEHTAIGAIAGTLEVCINQPTVAIKNALQEGRPLPANPAAYYRGLVVCSSILLLKPF